MHLIRSGLSRMSSPWINSNSAKDHNYIWKIPLSLPYNVTQSEEWNPIIFTILPTLQGEGITQAVYTRRLESWGQSLSTAYHTSLFCLKSLSVTPPTAETESFSWFYYMLEFWKVFESWYFSLVSLTMAKRHTHTGEIEDIWNADAHSKTESCWQLKLSLEK